MTPQKAVVQDYFDGFRGSDHERILSCLTEDVVWRLPGFKHLTGKDAFDSEIENDQFVGSPNLTIDRLLEDNDIVVAIGEGASTHRSGQRHRFAFCDVFTFAEGKISQVESYVVPLQDEAT